MVILQMVVHVDDSFLSTGSGMGHLRNRSQRPEMMMLGVFVSIGGQRVVATVDGH